MHFHVGASLAGDQVNSVLGHFTTTRTTALRPLPAIPEVMNRRAHCLPRRLVREHGVNGVTDHLQGLERHHHFVVFDVIADQYQIHRKGLLTGIFLSSRQTGSGQIAVGAQ